MRADQDPGWCRIEYDAGIAAWADAARARALDWLDRTDEPWRCGGTWRAGVDALDNAPDGSVGCVPLPEAVTRAVPRGADPVAWHPAQLSVVRPGYPRGPDGESDAAFAFRLRRDAAHVDGLLPIGPARRRHLREPHAFILGLPLTRADAGAAPLVVWEGSHRMMQAAFAAAFAGVRDVTDVDLTDIYQAARREVFARCRRTLLPGRPGEAVLLHRLLLHGIAPWQTGATADAAGRIVAYFRPMLANPADWAGEEPGI